MTSPPASTIRPDAVEGRSTGARVFWLRYLLGGWAGISTITYMAAALARMNYPYELEWMEGGTLVTVNRILEGQPVYLRPSPEYAPFFYTPFYYHVAAAASRLLGGGFLPLRLVSFLFSIGNFGWLFLLVYNKTKSALGGLSAAGLLAAAHGMTGLWQDLGRVDSMFLFFLLGSMHCMLAGAGFRSAVLAGGLIAASYFTKQTALAVGLWIFLHEMTRNPRRGLCFAAVAGLLVASISAWLDAVHGGWYGYTTRRLMLNQDYYFPSIYLFWLKDMLRGLPVCLGLALWAIVQSFRSGRRDEARLILLIGVGMVGASWLSRINIGGYRNVLIPAVAFAALVLGWSVPTGFQRRRDAPLLALLLLQFALLQFDWVAGRWNNPLRWIPTEEDRRAGDDFIADLRKIKGDVLLSNHPYLLMLAGKNPCAHTAGVDDVLRGDDGPAGRGLISEIRRRIKAGEYAAIILEREWIFRRDVERYYQFERRVFTRDDVFWPVTGWRTRPQEIWVPKTGPMNSVEAAGKSP